MTPPTKPPAKPSQTTIDKHEWQATYDVIVYGLDAGGAVAAITAAEEGAKVLVIDPNKNTDTGGYTRYCKQNLLYTDNISGAEQYFTALRGKYDHLDPKFIKVLAQGAADVPQWLSRHMAKTLHNVPHVDYSEFDKANAMKILRLSDKSSFDQSFYTLLLENLKAIEQKAGPYKKIKGSINYSYSTHLIELIQDPETKTILGVEVESKGKKYKVRATNGVILASGGFQNNEDMVENFLQMPEVQAKFKNTENGDGIIAAQKVGAALWHMGNAAAYELHFKPALNSSPPSMLGSLQGFRTNHTGDRACFIVGPNGYRFVNEAADLRLGHHTPAGEWVMQQLPTIAWVIFDEAGLTQAPLYPGWSQDNLAEVNKGWIIEAADMADLAAKLDVDPLNLEDQFLDYQDFCDNGYDPQFHRPNNQMKKLSGNGPYYALPVIPTIHHTLGGPERNIAAEVIDLWGKVIPHLYTTSNIGSVYPDIYPEGGDLTECIIFGRIAGTNAAKKK